MCKGNQMEPTSVIHTLSLGQCSTCYSLHCPITDFLDNAPQHAIVHHGVTSGKNLGATIQSLYKIHDEADQNPNLKDELFETYMKIAEIRDTCPYRNSQNTK